MPFRRPSRAAWYVQFATPRGIVRRSTGTTDRAAAEEIEVALRELRARGAADLLEAAADGRLPFDELRAARSRLDGLRAYAAERDLEPLARRWSVELPSRVSAETARRYRAALRSLVPPGAPFPLSAFTERTLAAWLDSLGGGAGARRRAHAAVSSFASFLVERGVIGSSPVRRVPAPAASPARCRWIDAATMARLAEAQPAPFCALSALLGGTGLDLATVLRLRRRDVDVDRRVVQAPSRQGGVRAARIADWAWRLVARHARAFAPATPLFAGVDRRAAEAAHRAACAAEGIADYRLGDQRHSWAVRAVRAGMPAELVAKQLGLAGPARVLEVYGRFVPERHDLDRWEHLATAQDAERSARDKVALGHALYHPVYQPRHADVTASRNIKNGEELGDSWPAPRRPIAGTASPGDTSPRTLRR